MAQDDLSCAVCFAEEGDVNEGRTSARRGMIREARQSSISVAMASTRIARTRMASATTSVDHVPGCLRGLTSGAAAPWSLSGIGSAWAFRSAALLINFAERSESEVVLANFISREACLVR